MLGRPSRKLWIAALVVSAICVAGLAYGLVTEWDTEPAKPLERTGGPATGGSGFGLGLLVGVGAGVVIGTLIAIKKRE